MTLAAPRERLPFVAHVGSDELSLVNLAGVQGALRNHLDLQPEPAHHARSSSSSSDGGGGGGGARVLWTARDASIASSACLIKWNFSTDDSEVDDSDEPCSFQAEILPLQKQRYKTLKHNDVI